MALEIWWVGKKSTHAEINNYFQRIGKYSRISEVQFKDSKNKTPNLRKEEEGKSIIQRLKPDDYLVLLDETGQQMTSISWSKKLNQVWSRQKRTIFLIGGAFGVASSIKNRSNEMIALSALTFPHEMARLILTEQLYRGFTILNNEKYHHA